MTYIITGFYGSGKTEFSLNLALELARQGEEGITLADLDVINPYFRSRERIVELSKHGVSIESDHLGNNTGYDLPAVSFAFLSKVRAGENVIIDLGGGDVGARLLAYCHEAVLGVPHEFLCVLNPFRSDTDTADKMTDFLETINAVSPMKVTGVVCNGHLLHHTTAEDVLYSERIVSEVGLPIKYTMLRNDIYEQIGDKLLAEKFMVFDKLQMRENWQ
ncbi:MAG: ATP-binding protein [Defluviitaleaceae bacterium]|nr:ATP-binding protein [Defluviitaleaceae bacterium]